MIGNLITTLLAILIVSLATYNMGYNRGKEELRDCWYTECSWIGKTWMCSPHKPMDLWEVGE